MTPRVALAVLFFVLTVGSGTVWLVYHLLKRKKLIANLLSLPKDRRYFWYRLRQQGFSVVGHSLTRSYSLSRDGEDSSFTLKADFLARRKGETFVCLFHNHPDDLERIRQYFVYSAVFGADGVVFYNEYLRTFTVLQ